MLLYHYTQFQCTYIYAFTSRIEFDHILVSLSKYKLHFYVVSGSFGSLFLIHSLSLLIALQDTFHCEKLSRPEENNIKKNKQLKTTKTKNLKMFQFFRNK